MVKVWRGLLLTYIVVGLGIFLPPGPAAAQGSKGDPVKITTIDGVELHGLFYPSAKKDAPTVILLHAIGDGGLKKSYTSLAEALQPNYSVLTFDFRGHGKSKDINPKDFWAVPQNAKLVKGFPKKDTIELADFNKAYYPVLCNDIAAVKAYLDRKNDTGVCNTSSTILIGAETGATLGAIWLNSQWYLHRAVPNPNNPLIQQASPDPEGKNVVANICLSISPVLGTWKVDVAKTLHVPVGENATATVFMYGDKDEKGKDLAKAAVKRLKQPNNKKYEFIVPFEVKGNTLLKGINLTQGSLKTAGAISDYLEAVVDKRGGEAMKRDFTKTGYYWRAGTQFVPAKSPLDLNNLLFESYDKFLTAR